MRLAVVLAAWADFATFGIIANLHGIEGEYSGLSVWLYNELGLVGVAGTKALVTLLVVQNFTPRWAQWFTIGLWTAGSVVNFIAGAIIL